MFKHSMAMEHVQDDLVEHINGTVAKKKVPPHGRVCVIEVVEAIAKDAPQQISPACAIALVNALIGCLEDSDPNVRERACSALSAFVGYGKRVRDYLALQCLCATQLLVRPRLTRRDVMYLAAASLERGARRCSAQSSSCPTGTSACSRRSWPRLRLPALQ